ncbi:hypothetical protein [Streptomyces sp. NPDC051132]|uniref:hypothetical protein n=1 Tax=unclassified Streptomyces TaxID=2593676 RepID=UPI0034498996
MFPDAAVGFAALGAALVEVPADGCGGLGPAAEHVDDGRLLVVVLDPGAADPDGVRLVVVVVAEGADSALAAGGGLALAAELAISRLNS